MKRKIFLLGAHCLVFELDAGPKKASENSQPQVSKKQSKQKAEQLQKE